MKVYCQVDERYPYFYLSEEDKYFYEPYEIELTEEEFSHYSKVSSEEEKWQSLLSDKVDAVRKKKFLESTANGIKPKGF